MSWSSAEERRKISERTKAGIRQKRAIGQYRGGRPAKGAVCVGCGHAMTVHRKNGCRTCGKNCGETGGGVTVEAEKPSGEADVYFCKEHGYFERETGDCCPLCGDPMVLK